MNSQQETQIIELESESPSISNLSSQQSQQKVQGSQGSYDSYGSTDAQKKETDLRDLLQTLNERKGFILALTALGMLISLLITLSTIPLYRANAIIKISPEENKLLDFDVSTGGSASKTEQYFRTQLKLLKSKALARKVIDRLQLDSVATTATPQTTTLSKPFFSEQLQQLKDILRGASEDSASSPTPRSPQPKKSPLEQSFFSRLHIDPMGKSYLVNVSYDAEDPELSATVVNSLIQNFISMNLEGRLDSASSAKSFLSGEIDDAKTKLRESEQKMITFEKSKGIVNTGGQTLINQKLEDLNRALSRGTQDRIAAEAAYSSSKSSVKKVQRVTTNATITALNKKLQLLNRQYQENLKVYKPAYPLMTDIQNNISDVRKEINTEKSRLRQTHAQAVAEAAASRGAVNPTKIKLEVARKNEAALKTELSTVKLESISTRDNIVEYQSLLHEVDASRELYESLLKRKKEVKVAGGVDKNNIAVIDPAVAPFTQHSPNTKTNLLMGALLGLFSSSLIALLLGHKDERIKSVEDIAKISDLPILGSFPFMKELKRKRAFNLITESSATTMAEAFRSLRTNMQFATAEGTPKILHITSSEASEGKSSTALNLASVFAQTKKSVLLIDADLRKPSIQRYLELNNTINLATGLLDGLSLNEMTTSTPINNLTVIAGEGVPSTPADLLSSDEMVSLLDQASDQYDLVIVDSPPVVGLADALVLANRSTATLLVVASHQTTKSQLNHALSRIRMGYGNVIGFAFTKARNQKASSYIYDYGGDHIASSVSSKTQARIDQ